eukprot:3940741-Rhodomonas_salina.3
MAVQHKTRVEEGERLKLVDRLRKKEVEMSKSKEVQPVITLGRRKKSLSPDAKKNTSSPYADPAQTLLHPYARDLGGTFWYRRDILVPAVMHGTEIAYGAAHGVVLRWRITMVLCHVRVWCYGTLGTERAYGAMAA